MANENETATPVFDEQNRPEPPKDENGNPIAPPEGAVPAKPEEAAAVEGEEK